MLVPFETTKLSTTAGGLEISMETGRMANQTHGTVVISAGGTVVLVTAVTQPGREDADFFPLTCNYLEKTYAAGRIPGGYFRREIGRPSDRETLVSRLIDRPIRPLFPKGFRDEVQIIATVLSADKNVNPDVLALTGASAALHISSMPFDGPIAGARVGRIDGQFVLYPTYKAVAEDSDLDIVFAASREAVVMVEASAKFLSEDVVADALAWGHKAITPLLDLQDELRAKVGKPKTQPAPVVVDGELVALVERTATQAISAAMTVPGKFARKEAKSAAKKTALEAVAAAWPGEPAKLKKAEEVISGLEKKLMRARIKNEGVRIDGRDTKTVRPLSIEVGTLPMTHGSALFRRGETSALAVVTLGSTRDEQRYETLTGEDTKQFMLHYNFPPYCVGEARFLRSPSRREIGHGALAERAISQVLPENGKFPFTIRVVSEVMDSNGSSSMATICGSTLALMDAGVPIKEPVAGIAMGLAREGDDYLILTDILGDEDALGDMDFKVAGSERGITAIQMDIKIKGIPDEVLRRALHQAREARLSILKDMLAVLPEPRPEISELAPQMEVVYINPEKIRELIGPGGKNIKAITADTGADIDIEDSGKVSIFAPTLEALEKTKAMVLYYDQTAEIGKNYVGTVKKILEIGAVVEILPGLEGLLHVSQIDVERVENVADVLGLGQEVTVKVVEVQSTGRIRLSRKAWLLEQAGKEVNLDDYRQPAGGGRGRDGGRDGGRGGYGGRDRDRGDRRR